MCEGEREREREREKSRQTDLGINLTKHAQDLYAQNPDKRHERRPT